MITFWRYFTAFTIIVSLPTLLAFGARLWWVCDLCTHFRVYYVILLLPCGVVLLAGHRFPAALLCLVFLGLNTWTILPLYFSREIPEPARKTLRGMLANVRTQNRQYDRFLACVEKENPDFLLVMEVDAEWESALSPLKKKYPHHLSDPRPDNFGIAFFSRIPAQELRSTTFGAAEVPAVIAKLKMEQQSLTFVGVHTLPPVTQQCASIRNSQLADLTQHVQKTAGPLVVMGDFNITPWSPHFSDLIENTNLRDSCRGYGVQPTWIAGAGLIRLPIDHVLVSPGIDIHNREVLPDIGSDHRPVVFDFSISAEE